METLIMVDRDGNEVEVERQNIDAAMSAGHEPAAEFNTPEGQAVTVRQSDFQTAFERGLKPKDYKEMSFWEATKAGAKRGWDVFASQETGLEPEKVSLEQEQAYQEHPVGYGLGMAAGMLPVVGGGAAAVGGGVVAAKKGYQAAKPYAAPSVQAAKERMAKSSPGIVPKVYGGLAAVGSAARQLPETKREMTTLADLERQRASSQAGAVNPQADRSMLGVEVLEPGMTPAKQSIAERAVGMAPGNLRIDPLKQAFEMGTTRRQEARNFRPEVAAEEVTPGFKSSLEALRKGRASEYTTLHKQAMEEYQPETGLGLPKAVASQLEGASKTAGITAPAKQALEAAKQILEEGPTLRGLSGEKFLDASNAEQFSRLKAARQTLREAATKMGRSQDPSLSNSDSIKAVKDIHDQIDAVMKGIPSQKRADELYREADKAKKAFFDAMEFGPKDKKVIDVPTVKRLFGDNPKAYRLREGIEAMRAFLDKYGQDIVPAKAKEMRDVVDRFDALRKVAEDKRLLEGLRQAQGPTSPVMERTESLRAGKGLPKDIFASPAGALNTADEFIAARTSKYFGSGVKFEQLPTKEKNALVRLLVWRQQNPDAGEVQEEQIYQKFKKEGK